MDEQAQTEAAANLKTAVSDILSFIDQEREREIITRRFGLTDRRETLEQIGELLGITRERVRQLEKAILTRLKTAARDNKLPALHEVERTVIRDLSANGRVGRVSEVTERLVDGKGDTYSRSHVAFIAELSPRLSVLSENDNYHHAIGISEHGDEKSYRGRIDEVVKTIKKHGQPITLAELDSRLSHEHPTHVSAHASVSKHLAHLDDTWGLAKWPTVNPKNIRDKIYVVLATNGKPMHFSDIARAIKTSDFKRKDVTTQAIHNELIKDKRFVLIGRGIYALDTWGYSKGTVADIITDVLRQAGQPLHRDEIVRKVLDKRQVKETTILLNLQSKPAFKRVAKATYDLAEK